MFYQITLVYPIADNIFSLGSALIATFLLAGFKYILIHIASFFTESLNILYYMKHQRLSD